MIRRRSPWWSVVWLVCEIVAMIGAAVSTIGLKDYPRATFFVALVIYFHMRVREEEGA